MKEKKFYDYDLEYITELEKEINRLKKERDTDREIVTHLIKQLSDVLAKTTQEIKRVTEKD